MTKEMAGSEDNPDVAKRPPPISRAMEDYLKTIYQQVSHDGRISTSELAEAMACSPASVTNMLQKLSDLTLVEYTPYQGVSMTPAGARIALEIIRHHRLIELYLSRILGYTWDKVHAEADRLEHVISEEFEEKIDQALGRPRKDPHGHPIPTKDGKIHVEHASTLWEVAEGRTVLVQRVSDRDPEVLRYLASIGILPEVTLEVVKRSPFNGPVYVQVDGGEHGLSEELAQQIHVAAP